MYSPRSTDFADNNDHELFGSDDEQEPPVAAAAAATESEKAVDETYPIFFCCSPVARRSASDSR